MQCTSYIPMYYHLRDLSSGASGSPWHMLDNNANYADERGYSVSLLPRTPDVYLSFDRDMLRQIIQNQEAAFRYQVQELHRVYRRQHELMDDMRRGTQIFTPHLLSQTSESFLRSPHLQSNVSQTSHAPSWLLGGHSHTKLSELTAENIVVGKNAKDLSSKSNQNENRIFDLELPADHEYYDNEVKQLANLSEAPEFPVKTDSSFSLNSRKTNCFIDLNEPIHPDSPLHLSSSSHLLNCDQSSVDINSTLAIDLNSIPVSCISDHTDIPESENEIHDELLKTEGYIDLNTVISTKPAIDTDLEGPVSPENEECSPPRGKSDDIQLEEPSVELDGVAAQTLVMLYSSAVEEQARNCLFWFAEIVSEENGTYLSQVVRKEKEMGKLTRGTRRPTEGFVGTGSSKRNAGKKGCPKPRKHSKLSCSETIKKPISSVLKEGWGKVKKREGGRRRKGTGFVLLS